MTEKPDERIGTAEVIFGGAEAAATLREEIESAQQDLEITSGGIIQGLIATVESVEKEPGATPEDVSVAQKIANQAKQEIATELTASKKNIAAFEASKVDDAGDLPGATSHEGSREDDYPWTESPRPLRTAAEIAMSRTEYLNQSPADVSGDSIVQEDKKIAVESVAEGTVAKNETDALSRDDGGFSGAVARGGFEEARPNVEDVDVQNQEEFNESVSEENESVGDTDREVEDAEEEEEGGNFGGGGSSGGGRPRHFDEPTFQPSWGDRLRAHFDTLIAGRVRLKINAWGEDFDDAFARKRLQAIETCDKQLDALRQQRLAGLNDGENKSESYKKLNKTSDNIRSLEDKRARLQSRLDFWNNRKLIHENARKNIVNRFTQRIDEQLIPHERTFEALQADRRDVVVEIEQFRKDIEQQTRQLIDLRFQAHQLPEDEQEELRGHIREIEDGVRANREAMNFAVSQQARLERRLSRSGNKVNYWRDVNSAYQRRTGRRTSQYDPGQRVAMQGDFSDQKIGLGRRDKNSVDSRGQSSWIDSEPADGNYIEREWGEGDLRMEAATLDDYVEAWNRRFATRWNIRSGHGWRIDEGEIRGFLRNRHFDFSGDLSVGDLNDVILEYLTERYNQGMIRHLRGLGAENPAMHERETYVLMQRALRNMPFYLAQDYHNGVATDL